MFVIMMLIKIEKTLLKKKNSLAFFRKPWFPKIHELKSFIVEKSIKVTFFRSLYSDHSILFIFGQFVVFYSNKLLLLLYLNVYYYLPQNVAISKWFDYYIKYNAEVFKTRFKISPISNYLRHVTLQMRKYLVRIFLVLIFLLFFSFHLFFVKVTKDWHDSVRVVMLCRRARPSNETNRFDMN